MKPVLVDTSVWRAHFRGVPAARPLGGLLDEHAVVLLHPFVLGEMVMGGLSPREEVLFVRLAKAPVIEHDEVLDFVRQRRLVRRGIGWVDAHLLASALASSALLWSLDADLSSAARDLDARFSAGYVT